MAYFTGEAFVHPPEKLVYVGTAQSNEAYGQSLVAHVYEVLP